MRKSSKIDGRGRPEKFTTEQFIEAIKKSGGLKTVIAVRLNSSFNTVTRYIEQYPEIAKAYQDEIDHYCDYVESRLMYGISRDNERLILFFLETKGKHRGWVKRQELTGADGEPISGQLATVDFAEILKDEKLREAMELLAERFTPELTDGEENDE